MKKYEFTGKTWQYDGTTLHEIRALRDLHIVATNSDTEAIIIRAGDIGGWIESEANLSHDGNCWVDDNARVYGTSSVKDDAYVGNNADVCSSTVANNARVVDNAEISHFSEVLEAAFVSGDAVVTDHSKISEKAIVGDNAFIASSTISGCASVLDEARVEDDSTVFENAVVYMNAVVTNRSNIYGNASIGTKARISCSEIYGSATITADAEVCGKKLCEHRLYRSVDFSEDAPKSSNENNECFTSYNDSCKRTSRLPPYYFPAPVKSYDPCNGYDYDSPTYFEILAREHRYEEELENWK